MEQSIRTIHDLANYLGLSIATVSRVLNGKAKDYRISDATSRKVLDAARRLNYRPNRIARGLKLTRTETLGLIVPDIANPFFASIAKNIELEARRHGYSLILCDSLDETETENELLQLMWERKVDGIIIAPVGYHYQNILAVRDRGIPVMVIDRHFPESSLPFVTSDNYAGAYSAVAYIISRGHSRIACIQGMPDISVNTDRVKGYRDALIDHHIDFDSQLLAGEDFGEENGYFQTRLLMSNSRPPTAILALSNLISLGAFRALGEIGARIPDDISLVSFDEQPYSAFLSVPMTTIDQRKDEMARLAVHSLLDMIKNPTEKRAMEMVLKPSLIIRDSVRKI